MDNLTIDKDVLIDKLIKEYRETNFIFKDDGYFLRLIYDNKALIEDEKFFDFVYDLSDEYLTDEEKQRLAVTYDYLKEINNLKVITYVKEVKKEIEIKEIELRDYINNSYKFEVIIMGKEVAGCTLELNNRMKNTIDFFAENNYIGLEKISKKLENISSLLVTKKPKSECFGFKKNPYIKECFN